MRAVFLLLIPLLHKSLAEIKVHTSAIAECGKSYKVNSDSQYFFGDDDFGNSLRVLSQETYNKMQDSSFLANKPYSKPQLHSWFPITKQLNHQRDSIEDESKPQPIIPLLYDSLKNTVPAKKQMRNHENWDLFNVMSSNSRHRRKTRDLQDAPSTEESSVQVKNKMDHCTYTFSVGSHCKSLTAHFTRGNADQMECENQFMRLKSSHKTTRMCKEGDQFKSQDYGRSLQVTNFIRRGVPRVPVEGYVICK